MQVGFLTASRSAGAIVMYFWCAHSDRTGERTWHVALPIFLGGLSLAASGYLIGPCRRIRGADIGSIGICTMLRPSGGLPTAVLGSAAAAGGIALINAVGNIGGYAVRF